MPTLKRRLCVPLQPPNFVGDAADLGHRTSIDAVRLINSRYVQFAEANVGKRGRRRTRPMQQEAPELEKFSCSWPKSEFTAQQTHYLTCGGRHISRDRIYMVLVSHFGVNLLCLCR